MDARPPDLLQRDARPPPDTRAPDQLQPDTRPPRDLAVTPDQALKKDGCPDCPAGEKNCCPPCTSLICVPKGQQCPLANC